jgi:Domain of unknown function (DUF4262)
MCWFCDHPDSPLSDYLDELRRIIDGHGWAVQAIERDEIHPPWAYTVGLTTFGQPELVATGLPHRSSMNLLNTVAEHLLHAPAMKLGEPAKLTGGQVIQILEVAEPTAHLEMAVELYGPQIRALQVVHADDRGHWPWECEYRGVRGGQPILCHLVPPATAGETAAVATPPAPTTPGGSRRPADQRQAAERRPRQGPGKRSTGRRQIPRSARRSATRSTRSISHPPARPR